MQQIETVCVYCGASSGHDAEFARFASAFGTACARRGLGVVFGGAAVGLMGRVAEGALGAGGRAVGVVPRFMEEAEFPAAGLTELVVVESLHARKQKMFELADGFVALPGGLGTLEEAFEIITWRQLGLHDKPIVLASCGDYWKPLVALLDHVVATGFARRDVAGLYAVAESVEEVFERLSA